MNIKDCYPMRKRRSLDKTPGRSTNNNEAGRLCTPRRITSNHPLAEQGLDVIWDNNSPSPSRTLQLGKRKKHVGSDSSSSGGEISDLVKKLADKTGQTPTNNSLLNYWLEEEVSHSDAAGDQHDGEKVKLVSKKRTQLKTPCRRPRELRKSRRNKNKLSKELEMLASMMKDSENISTHPSTSVNQSSSIVLKPINKDNTTFKSPCTDSKDKDKTDTNYIHTNAQLKSPPLPSVEDFGFNWEEDEEGDEMLSQMDISALCDNNSKDEVFTNTQLFNEQEQSHQSPNCKLETDTKDENLNVAETSFVTESWDFDDDLGDEDNLLQTLDEVERTQSIISNIPSTSQNMNSTSQDITSTSQTINLKEQNNVLDKKNTKMESLQSKPLYTKGESTVKQGESNKVLKVKNGQTEPSKGKPLDIKEKTIVYTKINSNALEERDTNLKVEPSQSKPLYSKEEIERKKLQALQKLKQKQKQKSLTTKLNVYRSRKS